MYLRKSSEIFRYLKLFGWAHHSARRFSKMKTIFPPLFLIILLTFLMFGCTTEKGEPKSIEVETVKLTTEVKPPPMEPRDLQFVSAGNARIVGTIYETGKLKSPAVLLLHQWQNDRKSFDAFAKILQEKGFVVLAIDGRGFGDSVKTTDGKTILPERTDQVVEAMKTDVDNAFLLLADREDVDAENIGIIGASYGSSLAIIYGSENKEVKAVAALSPGTNYFGNLPTEPAVKAFGDRPLLLVAANDDKDSVNSVADLASAADSLDVEVKVFEKGGHGTDLFKAGVDLDKLLIDFLTESLQKEKKDGGDG
jgi:dienelactone hydrolase